MFPRSVLTTRRVHVRARALKNGTLFDLERHGCVRMQIFS